MGNGRRIFGFHDFLIFRQGVHFDVFLRKTAYTSAIAGISATW